MNNVFIDEKTVLEGKKVKGKDDWLMMKNYPIICSFSQNCSPSLLSVLLICLLSLGCISSW